MTKTKPRIRYAPTGRSRTVMDLKTELKEWAKGQAEAQSPKLSLTRYVERLIEKAKAGFLNL